MTAAWREPPPVFIEPWRRGALAPVRARTSGCMRQGFAPMGETMWQMRLLGWDVRVWAGLPLAAAACLLAFVPAAGAAPAPTQLTLAGPEKPVGAGGKAQADRDAHLRRQAARRQVRLLLHGRDRPRQGEDRLEGPRQQEREADRARRPSSRASRRREPTPPPTPRPRARRSRSRPRRASPSASTATCARAGAPSGSRTRRVRVSGSVAPFVAGAGVEVSVFREQRRVLHETRRVSARATAAGSSPFWFKPSAAAACTA